MLTDEFYQLALWVWRGSALIAALYILWFFARRRLAFFGVFFALALAVISLWPAPVPPEGNTIAPAVVVAVVGYATGSAEEVAHLWQPLILGVAGAFVVALVLHVLWFRRLSPKASRRQAKAEAEAKQQAQVAGAQ